jgi:selenide,water dikinase
MLSDSQTSGGLLISIPDAEADDYVNAFNSKSEIKARIIGKVTTKSSELVKIY